MGQFPAKKFFYAAGLLAIPTLLVAWLVATYLLANRIPSRPNGVARDAVFLWAPAVGFPGGLPRRGWWLACWENAGHDRCRLSDIDGGTKYEGEFIRYGDRRSVAARELQLDSSKTTAEKSVWISNAWVALVYLKDGEILIPASAYDDGARLLTGSETH